MGSHLGKLSLIARKNGKNCRGHTSLKNKQNSAAVEREMLNSVSIPIVLGCLGF